MKKIRFNDLSELEIYDITESGDILTIDILNAAAGDMETLFSARDNLSAIQYFVGTDLIRGYAGYTELREYGKKMGQTISTDYSTPDAATRSGFAETVADILTVTLTRPSEVRTIASRAAQNRADIDYIAMETGVEV